MMRLFAGVITGIFSMAVLNLSGCKTIETAQEKEGGIKAQIEYETEPSLPQGLEQEIEEHGEP